MKNLTGIALLTIVFSLPSCAQESSDKQVPNEVKAAFKEHFPETKNVKWEMEDEGEWEAEFKLNSMKYSATFTENGEWKETEHEIKKSDLPANILQILNENFFDYEIEDAEIAETADGKSYELEIEMDEKEFEVSIDSKGNLTKKVEEDEVEND